MRLIKRLPWFRPMVLAPLAAIAILEVAAAAALPTTVPTLGSGSADVTACDTDGFAFRHILDTTGHVTSMTVSSIAAACAGGTLRLTLTNGTTDIGSGSVSLPSVAFSGSATVTISPTPLASSVTARYSAVDGP